MGKIQNLPENWWKWNSSRRQSYIAESKIYFNQLDPLPSPVVLTAIDLFIRTLVDTGIYAKVDEMWLHKINTKANSLIGMKGYKNCTEVGSVTFSAYVGITSGVGAYYNSNYNPYVDMVNLSQNSASLGIHCSSNVASDANGDFGAQEGGLYTSMIKLRTASNNYYQAWISDLSAQQWAVGTSEGFSIGTRTSSATVALYRNGSLLSTYSTGHDSWRHPNLKLYIGALNGTGGGSGRQYTFAFVGAGLNGTEVGIFNTALTTLLNSL